MTMRLELLLFPIAPGPFNTACCVVTSLTCSLLCIVRVYIVCFEASTVDIINLYYLKTKCSFGYLNRQTHIDLKLRTKNSHIEIS
mgnify:CR=1